MSYFYVATPYRAHPDGLDAAADAAERFTAELLDAGIEAYSPIAHTHHLAKHVRTADPRSDFWLERQKPFLAAARGVIVATHMPGWDKSSGIRFEIEYALSAGKPVLDEHLDPLAVAAE